MIVIGISMERTFMGIDKEALKPAHNSRSDEIIADLIIYLNDRLNCVDITRVEIELCRGILSMCMRQ